ncbi:6-phosphogluconolactonase [Tengunoibacter tsumagoiensis]|uniref:6-phosphogluconolactonase n=1 Tax=Tengunoibacter tsumagoiensis TaxID=2014871 RepID=A0A402A2Q8_9CHLR|nr:6-phosphogluconolactonase [Tengunoibacter tsumagoiensis]GCE13428.1 6-phosphogluconolactonase [Tengunoibacter tsumagoiensis]
MAVDVLIYPTTEKLSLEAADFIVKAANEAIADHGRFTLALSGGSTPRKLYGMLAGDPYKDQIDWSKVEIFWSDERCVPPTDAESNFQLAQEVMFSKLQIPAANIHRCPADEADRDAASLAYTQEMKRVFQTDGVPAFDLIQLGMGPEAHTCSLFPHQASLQEEVRLIMPVTVPKPPPPRLTFTPPLLNAARHVLFLVTGAEKAEALQAVLEGSYQPDEYPAQIVRPTNGHVTWMLDNAAAARLSQKEQER